MKSKLLLMSSCVMLLASCIEELDSGVTEESGIYSVTTLNVTDCEGPDMKSTLSVDPGIIDNIQVFAFDTETGSILTYGAGAGSSLKGKPVSTYVEGKSSFDWCLPVGTALDIYAIANIGKIDIPESVDALLAMNAMKLTFDSMKDLNSLKHIPMSGVLKRTSDDGSGKSLTIRMKKVLARYDVKVLFEDFPEGTKVTRLTVKNASRKVTLFGSGEAAVSASDLAPEMDYTTDADLKKLNSGESITLYLPENMQSTVNGAKTTADDWKDMNESNMTSMQLCSYMIISYSFEDQTGETGYFQQKVYFGKKPAASFDVVRNTRTEIAVRMGEDIVPDPVMDFQGTTMEPGESAVIPYDNTKDLSGHISISCFSTGDPRLSVSGFTAGSDGMSGSVTVTASEDFDCDTFIDLIFKSPLNEYEDVSRSILIDTEEIPSKVFFKYGSLKRGTETFKRNHVFAEYEDGSVNDISDVCTVVSSDASVASYVHGESVVTDGGLFYMPSSVSDYGISFGKTTGTATLTASYLGVSGTCSVETAFREVTITPDKDEIVLLYGESVSISINAVSNYSQGLLWSSAKVGSTVYPCMRYSIDNSLSNTGCTIETKTSVVWLASNSPQLIITAGNVAGAGTIKIDRKNDASFTNPITGQKDYGYGSMHRAGSTTIKVRIVPTATELGTLQNIRIEGPDKVMLNDNASFSAIGTFKKTDGSVADFQICGLGTWDSDAFGEHLGKGVFDQAATGSSETRSRNGTVSFTYHGMTATKPVMIYAGSVFDMKTRSKGTYWAPALYNPYENKRVFMAVSEPYIQETLYDCDGKAVYTTERLFECTFSEIGGTFTTDELWVGVFQDSDGNAYDCGHSTLMRFSFRSSGSYDMDGNPYGSTSRLSVLTRFNKYYPYALWDDWSTLLPSQRKIWNSAD